MKKWNVFLVTILFCLASLVSCAEQLPKPPSLVYEQESITFNTYAHGNYVFSEWGMGTQYNRTTGEIIKTFCSDPECKGDCFLENCFVTFSQMYQSRLYFSAFAFRGHDTHYAYYDVESGKVKVLFTLSENETPISTRCFVSDGYMYYSCLKLKDGGDADNPNDYHVYIGRIPADGGREEIVYEARAWSESLQLVVGKTMITYFEDSMYKTDLTTGEQVKLFDAQANGYFRMDAVSYYRGNIYISAALLNGGKRYLLSVDIETGEHKRLIDEPIGNYKLTDEAVYFNLWDYRQLNDPELYPPDDDDSGAMFSFYSSTLFACDHDGGNVRPVYTDETGYLSYGIEYTVIDGVYYGWANRFDVESNERSDDFFAEIHFDTGDIIETKRP